MSLTNAQMQAVIAAGGSITWRGVCYDRSNVGSLPSDADIAAYLAASTSGATVFGASGAGHAAGLVPDPGASAGTTKYLREDATFAVPPGSGSSISSGTFAARPAAGTAGRLYLPTDDVLTYYDTGSAWLGRFGSFPVTLPDDSQFSWVNQGSATLTAKGSLQLVGTADAGNSYRIRVKSMPATPYTLTTLLIPRIAGFPYIGYGLVVRESGTGKLHTYDMLYHATGNYQFQVYGYSDPTTAQTSILSVTTFNANPPYIFMRLSDDGANRSWSWSNDGLSFDTFYSGSRTVYLASGGNQFGFYANSGASNRVPALTVLSWLEA